MSQETIIQNEKQKLLGRVELDEVDQLLSVNALRILKERYLLKDQNGIVIETPKQLFERVAILMGLGEVIYFEEFFNKDYTEYPIEWEKDVSNYLLVNVSINKSIGKYKLNEHHIKAFARAYLNLLKEGKMKCSFSNILTRLNDKNISERYEQVIKQYYDLMASLKFLPNTPTLMNAGAPLGMLSACFTQDIEDDMDDIMDKAKDVAKIFKAGGGVGINYSKLRPEGTLVKSTGGTSSGPISFMKIIDVVADVVKQGGKRRAANMGILEAWHPDIEKFITAKTKPGVLENFNVSVGLDEEFWKSDEKDHLLDIIAKSAWKSAEPGLIFFDTANKYNPILEYKGYPLNVSNPCSEIIMYPNDSCNLGSIDVSRLVKDGEFDYSEYSRIIMLSTAFLDSVIDMNKYPLERIEHETKQTRRIGLGLMGVADALYKLCLDYDSNEGRAFVSNLVRILTITSMIASSFIAGVKGSFPILEHSSYMKGCLPFEGDPEYSKAMASLSKIVKDRGLRNCWTTTIAPTGTLSMFADCSGAAEPNFALSYEKRISLGSFFYTNKVFEDHLKNTGKYSKELIEKIAYNKGSIQNMDEFSDREKRIFKTAMDIHWKDHIMMQSVCQKWLANGQSKTINMAQNVTVEDVKRAYIMAHDFGCKGITVYRDQSRHEQVMNTIEKPQFTCDKCGFKMDKTDGAACIKCPQCLGKSCDN